MTETTPPHFCPGCGIKQKPFLRYPWHFCNACREETRDKHGRRIRFGNEGFSGGLQWQFDGEDDVQSGQPVLCLIHGRPVIVTEARFGGVVAQPLPDDPRYRPDNIIDLRNGPPAAKPVRTSRSPFGPRQ